MNQFKCTRCGEVVSGHDEYEAEVAFDNHECKNMPNLQDLPLSILEKLAMKEITEEEANAHDCVDHAVHHYGDGVLGDYYDCGKCGSFVQAG